MPVNRLRSKDPQLTCSRCTDRSSSHDLSAQTVCVKKKKKRLVHSCCVVWLLTTVSVPIKIQLKAPLPAAMLTRLKSTALVICGILCSETYKKKQNQDAWKACSFCREIHRQANIITVNVRSYAGTWLSVQCCPRAFGHRVCHLVQVQWEKKRSWLPSVLVWVGVGGPKYLDIHLSHGGSGADHRPLFALNAARATT